MSAILNCLLHRHLALALAGAVLLAAPSVAAAQPLYGSIDAPAPSATVGQPFTISGWAAWQNTGAGPGIDVVNIHGCLVGQCGSPATLT